MEEKSRRNKTIFIIATIILILLTISSIIYYIYVDNKLKNENEIEEKILEEIKQKEEELTNKQEELEKLNNNLKEYDNLDQKTEELKKEYFESIKKLEDKILNGESNVKIAYLTFDDGPYYNTYKVLDILDDYNVKATFFTTNINGEYCFDKKNENCYNLYNEYIKRGHTIANHTYTHAIWRGLYNSADSFMNAVVKQEEHIKNQTDGYVTNILRFPGGTVTAGNLKTPIMERLREKGYGWVDWTSEDGDGGDLKSKDQAWRKFTSTINSDIEVVLFHDYNYITTSILPDAIEYLENKGYIMLPLFYESNVISK